MDGNALLSPEVFATILATRALAVALAGEAERMRPGAIEDAIAAAMRATERSLRGDDFAEKVLEQLRHLQRQSLDVARSAG